MNYKEMRYANVTHRLTVIQIMHFVQRYTDWEFQKCHAKVDQKNEKDEQIKLNKRKFEIVSSINQWVFQSFQSSD